MYDLIHNIISHVWDNQLYNTQEQQTIYYICGALILLFTIWILDRISVFIINISKGGK